MYIHVLQCDIAMQRGIYPSSIFLIIILSVVAAIAAPLALLRRPSLPFRRCVSNDASERENSSARGGGERERRWDTDYSPMRGHGANEKRMRLSRARSPYPRWSARHGAADAFIFIAYHEKSWNRWAFLVTGESLRRALYWLYWTV